MENTNKDSDNDQEKVIQNKTFHNPYGVPSVASIQISYQLTEANFLRIKNTRAAYSDWSNRFFAVSSASFLLTIVNLIMNQINPLSPQPILSPLITGIVAFVGGLAIFVIGKNKSIEYTKIMKEIENHFDSNPPTQILIDKKDKR